MELDDYLQIFCDSGKGILKGDVSCAWSREYNRQSHDHMKHLIETEWLKRCQSNPMLFSALKFRLHGIETRQIEDDTLPQLKFLLGLTDYKDFIGTNCSPNREVFIQEGSRDYGDPNLCLANPLGNGAILLTNDNDVIFIKRSDDCAEFPRYLDRPGGHPEPQNILKKSSQHPEDVPAMLVNDELFNSILQEVNEEINIPYEKLGEPVLLGISFNPDSAGTPSMEFYVKCDLSTREVQAYYETRKEIDFEESTEMIVIPLTEILDTSMEDLCDIYPMLTHGAKCSFCLAKIYFS